MKKLLVLFFALTTSFSAFAADDKPISFEQLPNTAQNFITEHFKVADIALATVEREFFDTTYEVFFSDGCKIEFDKKGQWTDIDCKYGRVPDAAVPEAIMNHIQKNHPERYVKEIDRDTRDYEVQLDNGLELKFNLRFQLIGYDY